MIGIVVEVTSSLMMNNQSRKVLTMLVHLIVAISNFVTIVTNDGSIPVKFQSSDNSYTDGKTVVIGSKIDEKNFDPVVGLVFMRVHTSNFLILM